MSFVCYSLKDKRNKVCSSGPRMEQKAKLIYKLTRAALKCTRRTYRRNNFRQKISDTFAEAVKPKNFRRSNFNNNRFEARKSRRLASFGYETVMPRIRSRLFKFYFAKLSMMKTSKRLAGDRKGGRHCKISKLRPLKSDERSLAHLSHRFIC